MLENFSCIFSNYSTVADNYLEHKQIIASENQSVRWTTPLGLPVVQPYKELGRQLVSYKMWIEFRKLAESYAPLKNSMLHQQLQTYNYIGASLRCLLNYLQVKTSLQMLALQRETDKVLLWTFSLCFFFFIYLSP